MREELHQSGIGTGNAAINSFINDIINRSEEHHKNIWSVSNFCSLSELRDLPFYV